ncbi:MAG: DUF4845 domain-containing protein [Gammaproteobacteria bacterium]|jgi:hypothetical protein|nr:DUF4845 domain-containing protein [Gammaproteobacteria bacterium]MDP7296194.1 DUF4845 domain-containing protein [Gammaproteobacteria bacterium]MDP7419612.1 DUF4845 domain-containing protein [Gammaproteobacteria bacterium]MDP7659789.1 DUF4845 domain-containing protein [Gammaproteobacteria bacterium]HJP39145.1 DUF4845 domain-containing protein [Gammaproteobacteria bacterium]
MRSRQQGMTLISLLITAAFVGVIAFAVLKVIPAYLEQIKIISMLEDVKHDLDGSGASIAQIRRAIEKRLDVEMIHGIKPGDFMIKKNAAGYSVQVMYEIREPYIANLYLLVVVDKRVEIKR